MNINLNLDLEDIKKIVGILQASDPLAIYVRELVEKIKKQVENDIKIKSAVNKSVDKET